MIAILMSMNVLSLFPRNTEMRFYLRYKQQKLPRYPDSLLDTQASGFHVTGQQVPQP